MSLIFRGRPRLLPLAIALLASALTFGGLSLVGASLTVAQVAVLPVLVGLAVDYAIQFQSRVAEALAEGAPDTRAAILRATRVGVPTIATACAASAAATLVLLTSPVPMVQGLRRAARDRSWGRVPVRPERRLGRPGARRPAERRAGAPDVGGSVPRAAAGRSHASGAGLGPRGAGRGNCSRTTRSRGAYRGRRSSTRCAGQGACSRVGLALAALGWGLGTRAKVQTDITKLAPQNMASLQNLDTLERLSGVGGEIDLMVSGKNVVKPATIEWMSAYESAMLKRFGYTSNRGCGKARLCPAFSLPDLFKREGSAPAKLTSAQVNALLKAIPAYFSQDVIAPGHNAATLAFGIRLMGLDEQQRVIETMRAKLHPPKGVSAQLVGLPVLAAQANAQVASPWRRAELLLAGLVAVALVLLIAFRGDRRRAFTPLAPIVLASGWSALVLFAVRVPLNPMSVTLGALVIAIATEFSVLLAERHRQERLAGYDIAEALRRTYRHTGAAVAASGVTAIAGFGVLILSNIAMLRDFGLVTLIDLSVSLLGVLVALPAALMLSSAPAQSGGREGRALLGRRYRSIASLGRRRPRGRPGHEPV